MNKFAIVGLGFIAQRHIDAIKDIGGELMMACDVDVTKRNKTPEAYFFTSWQEMLENKNFSEISWVSICTPNNYHVPMILDCLEHKKLVICEKPIGIKSDNLKRLPQDSSVFTVLQLRHNPELQELREQIKKNLIQIQDGELKIYLHRDTSYFMGWKGDKEASGGLLFNIGIHYFDLLMWLFGKPTAETVYDVSDREAKGSLSFDHTFIKWHIAINAPLDNQYRKLTLGDKVIHLDRHFEGLHTKVYKDIMDGKGITVREASKAITLVETLYRKA